MQTSPFIPSETSEDGRLVQASLAGDRDAFGRIVARYQSLVCSLAYSATGSIERSEDLAQETFITAWRRLASLREPDKLRSWLCGIARHLISNAQRHAGREPGHLARPLDAAPEVAASGPSPSEQAVSREEAAILWQALGRIPETYREPLVLFYREGRSVEHVARELELSQDAVKQRLSRGRAMLHEQVLAMVEGTLERSRPGQSFLLGVMTALPVAEIALGSTLGGSAVKGAAGAKSISWPGALGVILSAQMLWFASSMAFVTGLGGWIGWLMADPAASSRELRLARRFWQLFTVGLIVFLLPVLLADGLLRAQPHYAGACALWLGLLYLIPGIPLLLWVVANHQRIRSKAGVAGPTEPAGRKPCLPWVAAATLAMSGVFAWNFTVSHWTTKVGPEQVWDLIATHPEAKLRVDLLETGHRWIDLSVSEQGKTKHYAGPLHASTQAKLDAGGFRYAERTQGRDYDVLGWPGRLFGSLTVLIPAAGIVLLLRSWRRASHRPAATPGSF